MTLENNRAPLLCYFKLCAAFRSHWWIQTGVTVRNRPIWVKIDDFFSHVTLKFDGWPWNTIGHLFYGTSSFVHHFITIGKFKLELQSGNAQFGSKSTIFFSSVTLTFDLWPWPFAWTSLLSLVITSENFMMIGWQEHCQKGVTDRQTDGQTEKAILRAAWSQLKICNINPQNQLEIYIFKFTSASSRDQQVKLLSPCEAIWWHKTWTILVLVSC